MQFSTLVLLAAAVVVVAAAAPTQLENELSQDTQPDVPLTRSKRGIFLLKKKLLLGAAAVGALKLKAGVAGVGALALAKAKYAKSRPSYGGGGVSYGGGYSAVGYSSFSEAVLDQASALSLNQPKQKQSPKKPKTTHCLTPLGYQCRERLLRQNRLPPTVPRGERSDKRPGPQHSFINVPGLLGGSGHSHIRRAPAYTFGFRTPADRKPSTDPAALGLSLRGLRAKDGKYRIKHGVISELQHGATSIPLPGPGQYDPKPGVSWPVAPRYTLRRAYKPPYQNPDCWSPSCNMYNPDLDRGPAYSMMGRWRDQTPGDLPGPGAYNEKYDTVLKSIPSYTHGIQRAPLDLKKHVPSPNLYCHKKFPSVLHTIPAPTFGIKHSPYIATGFTNPMPEELRIRVQCYSS